MAHSNILPEPPLGRVEKRVSLSSAHFLNPCHSCLPFTPASHTSLQPGVPFPFSHLRYCDYSVFYPLPSLANPLGCLRLHWFAPLSPAWGQGVLLEGACAQRGPPLLSSPAVGVLCPACCSPGCIGSYIPAAHRQPAPQHRPAEPARTGNGNLTYWFLQFAHSGCSASAAKGPSICTSKERGVFLSSHTVTCLHAQPAR